MDLKLKPFDFNQAVARAGLRPDGMPLRTLAPTTTTVEASSTATFGAALTQALKSVSEQQTNVQQLQREFSLNNPNVSLESVMIAGEKAKLGFTAALTVRNRLVQAYSEIMSMQV